MKSNPYPGIREQVCFYVCVYDSLYVHSMIGGGQILLRVPYILIVQPPINKNILTYNENIHLY